MYVTQHFQSPLPSLSFSSPYWAIPTVSHSPSTFQTFCLCRGIHPVLRMPLPPHFYLKPFHPWGGTDCWITQAFFTSTPLIRQSWVWLFIFFKSLLINFFNYLYHVFLCLDICFSCPAFLGQHVYWRERPKWVPTKKSGHD